MGALDSGTFAPSDELLFIAAIGAVCEGNTYCKNTARQEQAISAVGRLLRQHSRCPSAAAATAACAALADMVAGNSGCQKVLAGEGLVEATVHVMARALDGDAPAIAPHAHLLHQARDTASHAARAPYPPPSLPRRPARPMLRAPCRRAHYAHEARWARGQWQP